MSLFDGRTVLVTGASRGLGAELARAFALQGAFVGLGHRVQARKARKLAEELGEERCMMLAFDVRDRKAVEAAVQSLIERTGRLDVLVNNAALARSAWFAMDDVEAWDEVIAVNLIGAANSTRAVVRPMLARGGGVVVNVASVAALRAQPGGSAYAASKGGLVALTRTLAAELAPRNIRVNAVVPGVLDTGMALRTPSEQQQRWLQHVPAGRAGTAAEVARAVLFLASDESTYIHGHALVVDGGLSL